MRIRARKPTKPCSHFTPINELSAEPKCSRCAYFSTKSCRKSILDEIDYPDDDFY